MKYIRVANRLGHEITAAGFLKMAEADRQGKRRRADPPSKEKHTHVHASSRRAREMFVELENHCQLVDNVLRPLYEGEDNKLSRSGQRILRRLLPEVIELVQQLKHERADFEKLRR